MNHFSLKCLSALAATLISLGTHAAEIPLYPTGPEQDSSFIRFVNASPDKALKIQAQETGASLSLEGGRQASNYLPVSSQSPIRGLLSQGSSQKNITVQPKPGEFVSVLAFEGKNGLETLEVREEGDDFTAVRASVAFYDLNPDCKNAGVKVSGHDVMLFDKVEAGKWVRRQVNPVPLSVQLVCDGNVTGPTVDLGTLQAGERYSLFLVPGDPASGFFHIKDTLER